MKRLLLSAFLVLVLATANSPAGTSSQPWTIQQSGTSQTLMEVAFADTLTGIAVGQGGTIIRSTNGGLTWTSVTSGTDASLNGVTFASKDTVFIDGDGGRILRSTDAGKTFTRVDDGTGAVLWGSFFGSTL